MKYEFDNMEMNIQRKKNNMSLQKLADAVGSSKSYMWECEQGRKNPSGTIVIGMAKTFRCSMEKLFIRVETDKEYGTKYPDRLVL